MNSSARFAHTTLIISPPFKKKKQQTESFGTKCVLTTLFTYSSRKWRRRGYDYDDDFDDDTSNNTNNRDKCERKKATAIDY